MANFDPYHRWLGIPPEEQPPTLYRLLELPVFESDAAVIAEAVQKRSKHLEYCLLLGSTNDIRRLIEEVDAAGRYLANPQRKAEYDAQLRGGRTMTRPQSAPAETAAPPRPAGQSSTATAPHGTAPNRTSAPPPTAAPNRTTPPPASAAPRRTAGPGASGTPAPHGAGEPQAKEATEKSGLQKKSTKAAPGAGAPVDVIVEPAPADSPLRTVLTVAGSAAAVVVVAVGVWLALEHWSGDAAPADGSGDSETGQVAAVDRTTGAASSTGSTSRTDGGTSRGPTNSGSDGTTTPPPRKTPEIPTATDPPPATDPLPSTDPPVGTKPTPDPAPKTTPPETAPDPPTGTAPRKPGMDGPSKPLELIKPVLGGRAPVPKGDDLAAGEKKVASVFDADYAGAKKADERGALAKKLISDADLATDDDLPARYVMLRDARTFAVEAGDAKSAEAACKALGKTFEVDPHALLADSLTAVVRNAKQSDQIEALARAALDGLEQAASEGAFEPAEMLLSVATGAVRKIRQPDLAVKATAWRARLNDARSEFDKAEKARLVLAEKPDDPEANRAWGTYLCLVRQDWPAGLEALGRSGDPDLAKIAALEKEEPAFAPEQIALGDAWWDWIEKQPTGSAKGFRSAVRYWYKRAAPASSGLDRVKIEKRLTTIGTTGPVRSWPPSTSPGGLFKS